jgi:hypothetical protein
MLSKIGFSSSTNTRISSLVASQVSCFFISISVKVDRNLRILSVGESCVSSPNSAQIGGKTSAPTLISSVSASQVTNPISLEIDCMSNASSWFYSVSAIHVARKYSSHLYIKRMDCFIVKERGYGCRFKPRVVGKLNHVKHMFYWA